MPSSSRGSECQPFSASSQGAGYSNPLGIIILSAYAGIQTACLGTAAHRHQLTLTSCYRTTIRRLSANVRPATRST